jgi:hypothetical protein
MRPFQIHSGMDKVSMNDEPFKKKDIIRQKKIKIKKQNM